ncbi:polysaccharide deacetylase family protein [Micromonospora sp. M12]
MTEGARGWGRRDLVRRGLLVLGGVAVGAGTSEAWWSTHRRMPIAGGPASTTLGNAQQDVGSGAVKVVWSVSTSERLVALTFDDGPAPQWTPLVLDTLAQHRVPATFFMVGAQVRRHADVVRVGSPGTRSATTAGRTGIWPNWTPPRRTTTCVAATT